MKMRTAITIGATLVLTCAHSAKAQTTYRQLEEYAGVVLAYEITKDTCSGMNSAVIKDRVSQLDSELSALYGQHWLRAKFEQRGPLQLLLKGNCSLAAMGMLPLSMRLSDDAGFQQAFQRVANAVPGKPGKFVGEVNESLKNTARDMGKALSGQAYEEMDAAKNNRTPSSSSVSASPLSRGENVRLSKYVVETAFGCLRLGISADSDGKALFAGCLTKTAEQVEPLDRQTIFRLGFLVYRAAHAWGIEKGIPTSLPSPFEAEKRCARDTNPVKCMTDVTTQGLVKFLAVIREVGGREDLESFRDALVESGG